jgi:hypothetical protein
MKVEELVAALQKFPADTDVEICVGRKEYGAARAADCSLTCKLGR